MPSPETSARPYSAPDEVRLAGNAVSTPGQSRKLPVSQSPFILIAAALVWGAFIAFATWFLARPFLPPLPKPQDVVYSIEIVVAAFLIPGVIHSLIASTLFLVASTVMAWQSGRYIQRQLSDPGQEPGQLIAHRPIVHRPIIRKRSALRLGLGDRALGEPALVAGLVLLIVAYAALLSYVQFRSVDDFFASVFRAPLGWRWAAFLVFGLLAPLAEEMMFRGWLWTALRRSWPSFTCSLVTGLLWAATHVTEGMTKVAILLPVGLLLGLARSRSASLRAPLLLHVTLNLTSLVVPFLLQALLAN